MLRVILGLSTLAIVLQPITSYADWVRFRGPNGSGVSEEGGSTPTNWSPTKNIKWKVALPGPGSSSPIAVGDKIFVTCWSGYGVERDGDPGDQKKLLRHIICIDRKTGDEIWSTAIEPILPEDQYGGMFAEHGYASHTPVSDGENVYVFFGKSGALAFTLDGKEKWQTNVGLGSDPRGWGSASSPILYDNVLIVTAGPESGTIYGLDKKTGNDLWQAEGVDSTWGTPVLSKADDERVDLVLGVPNEFWGINPETGKLRWYCETMETDTFCSCVIEHDGIIYGIEGRGGGSVAVKVGGKGDVTDSHTVWTGRHSNRIGTPIFYDGRIYFFANNTANCVDAKTGDKIFAGRLKASSEPTAQDENEDGGGQSQGGFGRGDGGGGGYSSPVIADGKLYYTNRTGEIYVLDAGTKFNQLAVNRVTEDREDFSATPAISDGQLFVRSNKHLYCIAE